MVLATAAFVALPLPSGCDVPTGALNSTGVMSKRNELLLRSRATVSLAAQRDLQEDGARATLLTYLPRGCLGGRWAATSLLTYPQLVTTYAAPA